MADYVDFIFNQPKRVFHPYGELATKALINTLPDLNTKDRILDYGCGAGGTMRMLHNLGYTNIIGFDRSRWIEKVAEENPNLNFYRCWETLLQLESNIDYAIMESVLAFNNFQDQNNLVKSLNEIKQSHGLKGVFSLEVLRIGEVSREILTKLDKMQGVRCILSHEEFQCMVLSAGSGCQVKQLFKLPLLWDLSRNFNSYVLSFQEISSQKIVNYQERTREWASRVEEIRSLWLEISSQMMVFGHYIRM